MGEREVRALIPYLRRKSSRAMSSPSDRSSQQHWVPGSESMSEIDNGVQEENHGQSQSPERLEPTGDQHDEPSQSHSHEVLTQDENIDNDEAREKQKDERRVSKEMWRGNAMDEGGVDINVLCADNSKGESAFLCSQPEAPELGGTPRADANRVVLKVGAGERRRFDGKDKKPPRHKARRAKSNGKEGTRRRDGGRCSGCPKASGSSAQALEHKPLMNPGVNAFCTTSPA